MSGDEFILTMNLTDFGQLNDDKRNLLKKIKKNKNVMNLFLKKFSPKY